jgi:hypothetical protein
MTGFNTPDHAGRYALARTCPKTFAAAGSAKGYLIVSDIEAARDELVAAGIKVSEVFHVGPDGRVSGPDPEHRSYGSASSARRNPARRQATGAALRELMDRMGHSSSHAALHPAGRAARDPLARPRMRVQPTER